MCYYRRGLDLWVDLLTTYRHDSGLQAVTTLSLISANLKSPQKLLSLFRFYLYSLPCRTELKYSAISSHSPLHSSTELVVPILFYITSLRGPHRQHSISPVACVTVAARTCLPSRCPVTDLISPSISRSLHSNGFTRYNILGCASCCHSARARFSSRPETTVIVFHNHSCHCDDGIFRCCLAMEYSASIHCRGYVCQYCR
jgi:hypothetical protein